MSDIEVLNSLRLGTDEYEFRYKIELGVGGQGDVIEVCSKIDGKTYAGKNLKYQIGYLGK